MDTALLNNLKILLIDPDQRTRRLLNEVLNAALYKPHVEKARSISQAIEYINNGRTWDCVYIPFEAEKRSIMSLLSRLKPDRKKGPVRAILTLRSQALSTSNDVVELYLHGIHGVIAQPFTTDDITSLLTLILAPEWRPATAENQKVMRAAALLLHEAAIQVDLLAQSRIRNDNRQGRSGRKLATLRPSLHALAEQSRDAYMKALCETFERCPPFPHRERRVAREPKVKFTLHPGLSIRQIMTQRNLTEERVLESIRVDKDTFTQLLNLQAQVTPEIAEEIARLFGGSGKQWVQQQRDYNAYTLQRSQQPTAK